MADPVHWPTHYTKEEALKAKKAAEHICHTGVLPAAALRVAGHRPVKKNPNNNLMGRLEAVPSASLYTASVCVMELRYGALRMGNRLDLWAMIQERIISKMQILNFANKEALKNVTSSFVFCSLPYCYHKDPKDHESSLQHHSLPEEA